MSNVIQTLVLMGSMLSAAVLIAAGVVPIIVMFTGKCPDHVDAIYCSAIAAAAFLLIKPA